MLPDFPKLKNKIIKEFSKQLKKNVRYDPFLGSIRENRIFEGNRLKIIYQDGSFDESSFKKVEGKFDFKESDILEKGPYVIIENLENISSQIQKGQMQSFIESFNKVTEKTGNVVDGKENNFTIDLFLEALRKIDIEFDENEKPILQQILCAPNALKKIQTELTKLDNDPHYKSS